MTQQEQLLYSYLLPALGGPATLLRWLRAPGDELAEGAPLAIVLTEAAEIVLPATAGTFVSQLAHEGALIEPGAPLAALSPPDPVATAAPGHQRAETVPAPIDELRRTLPDRARDHTQAGSDSAPIGAAERPLLATPAARAVARDASVDLRSVVGSGPGGRVLRRDVEAVLACEDAACGEAEALCVAEQLGQRLERQALLEQRPAAPSAPAQGRARTDGRSDGQTQDQRRPALVPWEVARRQASLERAELSRMAPRIVTALEVDLTGVRALVARLAERYQRRGVMVDELACVATALVETLARHPALNAAWSDDGPLLAGAINLGLALRDAPPLTAYVVERAAELNLQGLARAIGAARAGTGRAGARATFTLIEGSGAWGEAPLGPGQVASLQLGGIHRRVVVVDGPAGELLAIQPRLSLTLSADARAISLPQADAFLADLRRRVEELGAGR